jgi:hypothetical protein
VLFYQTFYTSLDCILGSVGKGNSCLHLVDVYFVDEIGIPDFYQDLLKCIALLLHCCCSKCLYSDGAKDASFVTFYIRIRWKYCVR